MPQPRREKYRLEGRVPAGRIMIGVVDRYVTKSQRVCVKRGLGWMCGLVTGKSSRQGFESRYIIIVLRKQLS